VASRPAHSFRTGAAVDPLPLPLPFFGLFLNFSTFYELVIAIERRMGSAKLIRNLTDRLRLLHPTISPQFDTDLTIRANRLPHLAAHLTDI
jgi:hypothetical protein